jgi:hypothetical protein
VLEWQVATSAHRVVVVNLKGWILHRKTLYNGFRVGKALRILPNAGIIYVWMLMIGGVRSENQLWRLQVTSSEPWSKERTDEREIEVETRQFEGLESQV